MKWLWPLFSGKIEARYPMNTFLSIIYIIMQNGLVLVFDLDQTLIDSKGIVEEMKHGWHTIEAYIEKSINMRLVNEILRPAINLRRSGKVSAILLLTNNRVVTYIHFVERYIGRHLNILPESVFDYMMSRDDPMRDQSTNPPKSLMDVENILVKLNKPIMHLERRTFMFDDSSLHAIKQDLVLNGYPGHYIQVIGPEYYYLPLYGCINKGFIAGQEDLTDYRIVLKAMSDVEALEIIPSILSPVNEILAL